MNKPLRIASVKSMRIFCFLNYQQKKNWKMKRSIFVWSLKILVRFKKKYINLYVYNHLNYLTSINVATTECRMNANIFSQVMVRSSFCVTEEWMQICMPVSKRQTTTTSERQQDSSSKINPISNQMLVRLCDCAREKRSTIWNDEYIRA